MIDIEYLKQLKFKKVWLSDKSGYWYEKKIKHFFLKKLCIMVDQDSDIIEIECFIPGEELFTTFYECKATVDNLERILIWLDVDDLITKENQQPLVKPSESFRRMV